MKNIVLFLCFVFSTQTYAGYIKYNPDKHGKHILRIIGKECNPENLKYDDQSFYLKMNIHRLSDKEANEKMAIMKESQRQLWICIDKELKKSGIKIDLDEIFRLAHL